MVQKGMPALLQFGFLATVFVMAAEAAARRSGQGAWKADVRLPTPWTKDVTPTSVLQEYPRPQMQRDEWENLNGLWEFEAASGPDQEPPFGKRLSGRILVPFPPESGLSGVGESSDYMWYRRSFSLPAEWDAQRVLLHFGAVDWQATVYIDGKEAASHSGGYTRFSADITDALDEDTEEHELLVRVWDPTEGSVIPIGKQRRWPGGIWYTACSGIWQTVWLEPVPETHVASLRITPDLAASVVRVVVLASEPAEGFTVRVRAHESERHSEGVAGASTAGLGAVVGSAQGVVGYEVALAVPGLRWWSPEDPYLYDLQVELLGPGKGSDEEGRTVDAVLAYFGMRDVSIAKVAGAPRPILNGEFVFQVGLLDQGYWPDGIYTAPTDEALQWDIKAAQRMGFNLLRKHVKVEPDRWYYHADRLGMLVWQDMPSMFPPDGRDSSSTERDEYEAEFGDIIGQLHNFPSIITFTVFNEGWGEYEVERVTRAMQALDPSRNFDCASGWVDAPVGNYIDMHKYVGPDAPQYTDTRAAVLGEFGGLGVKQPTHMWDEKNIFFYELVDNGTVLQERYLDMVEQLRDLMRGNGLSASVYTELTDCEGEINGMITYDRALFKMPDLEAVAAAHASLISESRKLGAVASAGVGGGAEVSLTRGTAGKAAGGSLADVAAS